MYLLGFLICIRVLRVFLREGTLTENTPALRVLGGFSVGLTTPPIKTFYCYKNADEAPQRFVSGLCSEMEWKFFRSDQRLRVLIVPSSVDGVSFFQTKGRSALFPHSTWPEVAAKQDGLLRAVNVSWYTFSIVWPYLLLYRIKCFLIIAIDPFLFLGESKTCSRGGRERRRWPPHERESDAVFWISSTLSLPF